MMDKKFNSLKVLEKIFHHCYFFLLINNNYNVPPSWSETVKLRKDKEHWQTDQFLYVDYYMWSIKDL